MADVKKGIAMKSIQEILDNYDDYKIFLDDRFGCRLIQFLEVDQLEKIGFKLKTGATHIKKEWTEQNILVQLKEDLSFGWEKCQDERGISSSLLAEVVKNWCKVLENGLENTDYGWYGDNVFKTVAKKYEIEL